jgi:DNA-binding response OmpR family regulator
MRPRILVVDDDEVYVAGMAEWLEAAGYETLVATTFEEGRRALREDSPDLMIVDVRLGEFNGLQLTQTSTTPRIPALVVSAYDDPVLRADATAFGATYLVKPVDPETLLALIARHFPTEPTTLPATHVPNPS